MKLSGILDYSRILGWDVVLSYYRCNIIYNLLETTWSRDEEQWVPVAYMQL